MLSLSSRRAWIEIKLFGGLFFCVSCRSPHGERGLKSICYVYSTTLLGRSPHGERGLKFACGSSKTQPQGRSPHGERGLKCISLLRKAVTDDCRSPHGERGLK